MGFVPMPGIQAPHGWTCNDQKPVHTQATASALACKGAPRPHVHTMCYLGLALAARRKHARPRPRGYCRCHRYQVPTNPPTHDRTVSPCQKIIKSIKRHETPFGRFKQSKAKKTSRRVIERGYSRLTLYFYRKARVKSKHLHPFPERPRHGLP